VQTPSSCPTSRCAHRFCQLVLLVSAASLPLGGHAANGAASAPPASSSPPCFPDELHVINGCFISTLAYVARFRAAFPAERAQPLAVEPKAFRGMHTITVLSWQGSWWGRDEYFGVFPLGRRVDKYPDPGQLVHRAEVVLDAHVRDELDAGRATWEPPPPRTLPTAERARLVAQAAALLPEPSEMFWVRCQREEIPVLFFRLSTGLICVYEPLTGTAQAESATTHPERLVRAFAVQLGYQVLEVRVELKRPVGDESLAYAAGPKSGAAQ
jgi:hypothetical protein